MDKHKDWTKVPAVIKRVFDRFPLVTYEDARCPNTGRSGTRGKIGTVFVHERGGASIYPESVRLITILKIAGLYDKLEIVPSSTHASPNNTLPYIYLVRQPQNTPRTLYPNSRAFYDWLASAAPAFPKLDQARLNPVLSLIEVRLRDAWLLTLYAYPSNYNDLFLRHAALAYSSGTTAVPSILPRVVAYVEYRDVLQVLSRGTGAYLQTQSAQKSIIANAAEALDALETLTADKVFGGEQLGIQDAALHAYIWTILTSDLKDAAGKDEAELRKLVKEHKALVELAGRIQLEVYMKS